MADVRATYRLQVRPGFDLEAATALVDYLAALGVSHVYTSPLLRSAPGSEHGYDVVDPTGMDPELGGEAAYDRFSEALAAHGLGHVLDIVPNHMAVVPAAANPWWWDVLARGRESPHARIFDVDWEARAGLRGRVLVPVLGEPLARELEAGTLRPEHDRELGLVVRYHEHGFPLVVEPAPEDPAAFAAELAGDATRLAELLEDQHYRLAEWRRERFDLNYRRFFTISSLVGVRVEDPEVFRATHPRILDLVRQGRVTGLRIDHPDGLRDPEGYLRRLRGELAKAAAAAAGATDLPRVPIWVEKILEPEELLREEWPVEGTTGYDFAAQVSELLVDPAGAKPLVELHAALCAEGSASSSASSPASWPAVVAASKRRILDLHLGSEVGRLVREARCVLPEERPEDLEAAFRELLVAFPVYRTYVRAADGAVAPEDEAAVARAAAGARAARPELGPLVDRLAEALLLRRPGAGELAERFQQVAGPVMAKGVEDTAFYRYVPLAALCEVGHDPGRFGAPAADFHAACRHRAERWPRSLLATSTHDTKRSEDVRARLLLLAELPEVWARTVRRWRERNAPHRRGDAPEPALEHLLYQTLVGAHPLSAERAVAYLEKAAKEAKTRTAWVRPDPDYAAGVRGFAEAVLADPGFRDELEAFVAPLVEPGRVNALAQALLRLTAPGVPDLYQGGELWDLSLVDPDNRRPVDYARRRALLARLEETPPDASALREALADPDDPGVPKLWLIRRALELRRRRPELFAPGSAYEPLAAEGARAEHAVAFARRAAAGGPAAVAVVPRWPWRLSGVAGGWADTRLLLPSLPPGHRWHDLLTGARLDAGTAPLAHLLTPFPLALLEGGREGGRS